MQRNTPQYRKLLIKNLVNPDGSKLKPPKGKTATIQDSTLLATSFPGFSPTCRAGRREPWERGCAVGRKIENTVETRFKHIRLIRTPRYYGQLSLSLGKVLTFSQNLTRLIRTPVDTDNRHLFLPQSTDSHRKPTSLMWTLHYQPCAVIDLSFLEARKPLFESMLKFPAFH